MYDKTYIRRGKMGHRKLLSLALLISQTRLNNSGCPILPCRISVYYSMNFPPATDTGVNCLLLF